LEAQHLPLVLVSSAFSQAWQARSRTQGKMRLAAYRGHTSNLYHAHRKSLLWEAGLLLMKEVEARWDSRKAVPQMNSHAQNLCLTTATPDGFSENHSWERSATHGTSCTLTRVRTWTHSFLRPGLLCTGEAHYQKSILERNRSQERSSIFTLGPTSKRGCLRAALGLVVEGHCLLPAPKIGFLSTAALRQGRGQHLSAPPSGRIKQVSILQPSWPTTVYPR